MMKYVVAILHIVGVDFWYVGAIIKNNLSIFFCLFVCNIWSAKSICLLPYANKNARQHSIKAIVLPLINNSYA
jgi:hypothetical protein